MSKQKFTESDLIKNLIPCLQDWGWDIYQEVEGPGGRVDIVAARGRIQWAIEAKLSFGLPVIEQAHNWRTRCHYSSVAIPSGAGTGNFARGICQHHGIGILRVQMWDVGCVTEAAKPRLNRRPLPLKLYEEQKTFCDAGSNRGGHWTPFKRTCRNLVDAVTKEPGMEFKSLIKVLDHHYSSLSSARSCLLKFITTGVIPELRTEAIGGKLWVFLREAA